MASIYILYRVAQRLILFTQGFLFQETFMQQQLIIANLLFFQPQELAPNEPIDSRSVTLGFDLEFQ